MYAPALIDCNVISIEAYEGEDDVRWSSDCDEGLGHQVALGESNIESAWDEFRSIETNNSIGEGDISGYSELEVEPMGEDENAYNLLWLQEEMDKYYESISNGDSENNLDRAYEAKNTHIVVRRTMHPDKDNPSVLLSYEIREGNERCQPREAQG